MIHPRNFMHARLFGWGWWLCAGVVAGGLAWPAGADAQINPFRGYKGPTLTKEDLASGQAAAEKLLGEDRAEVGKSEDWAGPSSGNSGRISVLKTFQRQGLQCRELRSEVRYKRASSPRPKVVELNVCRGKTGEWKIM